MRQWCHSNTGSGAFCHLGCANMTGMQLRRRQLSLVEATLFTLSHFHFSHFHFSHFHFSHFHFSLHTSHFSHFSLLTLYTVPTNVYCRMKQINPIRLISKKKRGRSCGRLRPYRPQESPCMYL
ncbi:hypothetical protein BKA91DRAFT_16691 [Yarrowia lipolytica]|nr:hypothetical protein BKA91DRAFT_16691 [Yarrowia lipolytica]KAE8173929.1 hypothetical protein BKA90DRAFT_2163 [Yarrowia lipolytica]RMI95919.1 hypothetical protein BD777DRAFT_9836 [Yarrowia lipolytica]